MRYNIANYNFSIRRRSSLIPRSHKHLRFSDGLKTPHNQWKMMINTSHRSEFGACFVFNYYPSPAGVFESVTPNLKRNFKNIFYNYLTESVTCDKNELNSQLKYGDKSQLDTTEDNRELCSLLMRVLFFGFGSLSSSSP
jgi:hypothetical protein